MTAPVDTSKYLPKIKEFVASHRHSATAELQSWVRVPSLPGGEEPIQKMVSSSLQELGMTVDFYYMDGEEMKKSSHFMCPRTEFSRSPNVVGTLKGAGGPGAKSIILNGHVDVVPVGDLAQWTISPDPFSGLIKDGKLYGRGVTDMKGGLFAQLLAIRVLSKIGVKLRGDVIFQSVVEEETGSAGTLSTILRGYKADAALIAEPSGMKIFPKQQGSMWFTITVKGRGAHGGTRYEGVSAIEKAMKVIQELQVLEKKRNDPLKKDVSFQDLPIPVPINVGVINGGKWRSSVPDLVTLEGRFGVIPGETFEEAKEELKACLDALSRSDEWLAAHPVELEWVGGKWMAGAVPSEHPLVGLLAKNFEVSLGPTSGKAKIQCSPWGTDGALLTNLANTPSIVFGPGVTAMAHYSDEYIVLDDVFNSAEIMALTLLEWCGVAE